MKGMNWFVVIYFILGPLVVLISIIWTFIYRRKRLNKSTDQPLHGFHETDEIFIDPTTGIKQRVWFNPYTGQRHYQIIDENRRE